MIILLYGQDTYRSRSKLNEILAECRSRIGAALDFFRIDAEGGDFLFLQNNLGTDSLFAAKKLIVVENIFADKVDWEGLKNLVAKARQSESVILVLWGRELGERSSKKPTELKPLVDKTQEFKNLTGSAEERWLREEAEKRGLKLSREDVVRLCGNSVDSWSLVNELDKMVVGGVEAGSGTPAASSIFQLGDHFFSSTPRALTSLCILLRQGHDEYNLFSYLVNQVRTLLVVKNYLIRGERVPTHHGIHPYVIKKASAWLGGCKEGDLRFLLQKFLREDHRIKVGISKPKDSLIRILLER